MQRRFAPEPTRSRGAIDLLFTFCSTGANRCRLAGMIDNFLLTLAGATVILLAALLAAALVAARALRQRDRQAAEARMAELARLQAETAVRIEDMRDMLAGRQAELHRAVNERLAVIDSAQRNITDLASQVTSLQGVLANKQSRGAFGQGRMELIIQDGLPKGCYQFQFTLSNRSRPDCAVFLPDGRPLTVDAKFPLEAVTALREAKGEDDRKQAATRVRQDVSRHIGDIAEKYLIP